MLSIRNSTPWRPTTRRDAPTIPRRSMTRWRRRSAGRSPGRTWWTSARAPESPRGNWPGAAPRHRRRAVPGRCSRSWRPPARRTPGARHATGPWPLGRRDFARPGTASRCRALGRYAWREGLAASCASIGPDSSRRYRWRAPGQLPRGDPVPAPRSTTSARRAACERLLQRVIERRGIVGVPPRSWSPRSRIFRMPHHGRPSSVYTPGGT